MESTTICRAIARAARARGAATTLALAGALASCSNHTQLVIRLRTDMATPTELHSIDLQEARVPERPGDTVIDQRTIDFRSGEVPSPIELGILSHDASDTRRVQIDVTAHVDTTMGLADFPARAVVSFTPDDAVLVTIFLAKACGQNGRAQQCAAMGLTCGEHGDCVQVDQNTQPLFDSNGNAADAGPPDLVVVDVPVASPDVVEAGMDDVVEAGMDAGVDAPVDVPIDHPIAMMSDVVEAGADVPLDSGPCAAGTAPFMGRCVALPTVVGPLTGTRVASNLPVFSWGGSAPLDGANVEICHDAACTMPITTLTGTHATSTRVPAGSPLPEGIVFWRLVGTTGGVVASAPTNTRWIVVPAADHGGAVFGSTLDLNGDAIAEIAVGAPTGGSGHGAVYIYRGPVTTAPAAPDYTLIGPGDANGHFGASVASAGDVNQDGYGDLVVGAPDDHTGDGTVYVYFGSATGPHTTPDVTIAGSVFGAAKRAGQAVSAAGDVTQDGYGDVLVSAAGAVALFPGGPMGTAATTTSIVTGSASFGTSVSGDGDVNGDGIPDFLVGAPIALGDSGDAYLYEPTSPASLPTMPAFTASMSGGVAAALGQSVVATGDYNADGHTDILVGAPMSGAGLVLLWPGTAGTFTDPLRFMDLDATGFGTALAMVRGSGSIGGDTIVVGSLSGSGFSYYPYDPIMMMPGPESVFVAPSSGTSFGSTLAAAGDVNGDGVDDLIVGSPGGDFPGSVYVFFGHATAPVFGDAADVTITSSETADGYAQALQ